MNWSVVTACNNEQVLDTCLRASPGLASASELKVIRGSTSAAKAYNTGIQAVSTDVLVLAHQDVYFPEGWDAQLAGALERLEKTDPGWAVLGVVGITRAGDPKGHLYCTGLQRVLGSPFASPVECSTLDEVVLILRRSSGLKFDEQLPGFHLYGTDICCTARQKGLRSYIISAFCLHNTAGLTFLPKDFWKGYFYLRRKWSSQLPIRTPCITISKVPVALLDHPLRSAYAHYVKRVKAGTRLPDPAPFYQHLCATGRVQPGLREPYLPQA